MTTAKFVYSKGAEHHALNPNLLASNAKELARLEQEFYAQAEFLADMLGYYAVPPEEGCVWAVQSQKREKNLVICDVINLGEADEPFGPDTVLTEVKSRDLFANHRKEVLPGFYSDTDIFPISRIARKGAQLMGISAVTNSAVVTVDMSVRILVVSQGEIDKRVKDIESRSSTL